MKIIKKLELHGFKSLLSSAPMEQEKATLSTLCSGFSGEAAQNPLEAVGAGM